MKYIKYILIFFAGIMLALFISDRWLTTDEVIEVRYDSLIYKFDTIPVPVPYKEVEYITTTSIDSIFSTDTIYLSNTIDSAEILAEYLKKRIYKDTISNPDLSIYLDEVVQYNQITSRDVSYQIFRPTEVIQNTSFYVGFYSYNIGIVPYAQYNRNKWSVSLGFDPMNTRLFVGGAIKVR